ncbi:MAG: phosphoenolpyruvate synthase [Candidatus Bilamarchaeaceae archaeon]
MENVMWFEQLTKKSLAEAGGKGANLGEMYQSGFPIPPGFVTTSGAYYKFIDANGLKEKMGALLGPLDVDNNDALNDVSAKVKSMIMEGAIPQDIEASIRGAYKKLCDRAGYKVFVAVRSSATAEDLPTASFAGQQSTFLNVQGEDNVVAAVKECWASLFEPRAIFYRVQNHFDHMKVALAAVVQQMVQSERSGVMFSVDPMSQDVDLIMIEGAYGLGEVVVSGSVTPDTYLVSKGKFDIVEKRVARQTWMLTKVDGANKHVDIKEDKQALQKLSDTDIRDLAKIGAKIEGHYGVPQDIEWAVEKGNIYIVQSRPITTLKKKAEEHAIQPVFEESKQIKEPRPEANAGSGAIDIAKAKAICRGFGASPGVGVGKVKLLKDAGEIRRVVKGDILVTDMTTPDFVPAMKKAAAIVTNTGGMTSHAAIVSRELGIPCIVGTGNATSVLADGASVTVDGTQGIIYEGIVAVAGEAKQEQASGPVLSHMDAPVTGTKVYVNLAEVELAEKVAKLPVDGVGLLRAEFIIAGFGEHPRAVLERGGRQEFVDHLANNMRRFAAAFYPRPVVYRATDFKTNEYRNLKGGDKYEPKEENPMMGYRGAVRYMMEPDIFKMELEAIKKVRDEYGLKNLWLMIPFVRRIGELRAIKEILHSMGIYRTRDFKMWIMVEVPSTVFLMDLFCKEGIDGVSIGSNDLTQLTLGIDRDNATLAKGFDERNDAVLRAIHHVIKTCNQHGITVSICGQAPSVYPEFTEKLIEFGVTSVSVNPDAVDRTKRIVASVEQKVMLKRLARLTEGHEKGDNDGIYAD